MTRVGRQAGSESTTPGMGIQFVDVDDDTRNALVRVLEGTDAYRALMDADNTD